MLIGALVHATVSVASDPSTGRPRVQADKPLSGHPVKVTPRKHLVSSAPAPAAAWPVAGRASASVPTVDTGPAASAALAGLPVALRAPHLLTRTDARVEDITAPPVGSAEISVEGQAAAERAGVDGLLMKARRTDNAAQPGKVGLEIDYRRFAQGYGGGYGSRLRLIQLPACALTTPDETSCRTGTPVAAVNDTARQTLTATVTLPAAGAGRLTGGEAMVLAAVSGSSSDGGDYKATSLSPSGTWQISLNTGDFSWSYSMPTPAVPGNLAPDVGVSYSSSAIDGRTATTNNQSSWVGDGFDLWPGYIERGYKSCSDDGAPTTNGLKPPDQCWGYDNATISLNGKSGELIPAGTNTWKLKQDDGTRIEKLNGSSTDVRDNGDNDQEYWRVTTTDGTQYYFGYHKLPNWATGNETTDSTWTVPVFGNNTDEPCNRSTFATSWCQQAWRWNLDYVVDRRGDAMAYYYNRETNSYGRNLTAADDTLYTRGGTLDRIEYGLRSNSMYSAKALAKVVFGSSERCLPVSGVTCAPDTIDTQSSYWYDTPWDQNCTAGTDCSTFAPTFWTRKRLTSVTTQRLNSGGTYTDVDSWRLNHQWGMADINYQLLLDSIERTGKTATPNITLPKVTFSYHQDANRLDKTGDGTAPFIKERLSTVMNESGGQVDVNYSTAECDWAKLPTPETNTTRCFPVYYTASGDLNPSLQWFNKYVVTSVTQSDRTNASPDMVTNHAYLDGAAWHYDDDDGLTEEKHKTWSQWHGYRHVRMQTGGPAGMVSQADHYFQRGMNGDRLNTAGGSKTVTLDNGEGATITDWEALTGFEYRTEAFSAPGGRVLAKTVNHGWFHQAASRVRSWGTTTANLTGTDATQSFTSLDDGAGQNWRQTMTKSTFEDTAGRITQVDDLGDNARSTDDRCTRITYLDNTDANLMALTSRTETVAVKCDTTPARANQVISDVRIAYDGSSYTAAPTKGEPWFTATLKSHNGTTGTYLESGATYDQYGRQLTATDLTANVTATNTGTPSRVTRNDGRTTTTTYTPSTGLPTTVDVTTPPADPTVPTSTLKTTTTLDPLRGLPTLVQDPNTKRTRNTYDALGRVLKTWLPDRPDNLTPNVEHTYTIADNEAVAVGTKTVNNDGSQDTSYLIYDGFLRARQTQAPGPNGGRLVSDTFYDERGLTGKEFAPYYMTSAPSRTLIGLDDALSVETQTWHRYDGLGREIQIKHVAGNGDGGMVLGTTTTTYGGDRVTVIPPTGGTTTTALFDTRGRTAELWQYHTAAPTGTPDKTIYGYTPQGNLGSIVDADENSWSYTYDQLGRQKQATDPDTGTRSFEYDDRGQLLSSTDSRTSGNTLAYVYDGLGRKTELHADSATGPKLASWAYDTAFGAKGELASATRYDNGKSYTTTISNYDGLYRVTRSTVSIPDVTGESALAGTYQFNIGYNPDGTLKSTGLPPEGALPGESIDITYDSVHRPIRVSGTSSYLTNILYSYTGKPQQHEVATTSTKHTWLTSTYEWGTQRLKTSRVDREGIPGVDRYTMYGYDTVGNILSMADTSRDGTDNQCFTYDALQRLTEAWAQNTTGCAATPSASVLGGPAPYWQSLTYGATGNRATQIEHAPSGNTAQDVKQTYTYPAAKTPQPHTLTKVDTTGPNGGTAQSIYSYDPSGNTRTRTVGGNEQELTWDAEGHLVKVAPPAGKTGPTTSYLYDADGNRLLQRTANATTLYLASEEITIGKGGNPPTTPSATRYYDLGNGIRAVRTNDNKVSFHLPDHQATGELAIDASTLAMQQRRTTPFGGLRGTQPTAWPGTKGFVGGTNEPTGFTHLGARDYDPTTGRFISADPILAADSPQQMNGYAYSGNNPVTTSDPTGLCPADLCGVGTPKGDGSGKIITEGPLDPGNPAAGSCHHGQCYGPAKPRPQDALPPYLRDTKMVPKGPNGEYTKAQIRALISSNQGDYNEWVRDNAMAARGDQGGELDLWGGLGFAFDLFIPYQEGMSCFNHPNILDCSALIPVGGKGSKAAKILNDAIDAERDIKRSRKAAEKAAAACRNSFPAGTLVLLADGTVKPIEELKVGDKVAATDPETAKSGGREVDATIVTPDDTDFTTVTVDGKHSFIVATDHHPFWSPSAHAWVDARDLKSGMTLRTADGHNLTITATTHFHRLQTAYNLTVRDLHTYYVLASNTPVLVHNYGGGSSDPIGLGSDYTGRLDRFPMGAGTDFEIHVYHRGSEVGIFGSNGWFDKHGKVADVSVPDNVYNRLKGKAVEEMRASGRLGPQGTRDITGDKWKMPRLKGGC
ncbi:polymorphic toxin-type HINT domain-containing protein [Actinoplanes sp. NPDC051513]|uniref:polymorphic toxin-type HINT domain-containing protein n=1 Tax=Actinoplanes sp. NPDC051513 TaxID=3363908 RepID=UPI003798FB9E